MKKQHMLAAALIAGLVSGGTVLANDAAAPAGGETKAEKAQCKAHKNKCKGKKKNACAGKNGCKGEKNKCKADAAAATGEATKTH